MKAYYFMLGLLAVFLLAGCTSPAPEATSPTPVPGFTGVDEKVVAGESDSQQNPAPETTPSAQEPEPGNVAENKAASPQVKEFDVTAKQWEFIPDTITVNKGDTVILNVESIDVNHGISIPQFGVGESLSPGKKVTVEFVADKAGTFSFYCSVYCGEGHSNMKGTLIVE